ncbi:MAG TPA: hypothetical protein VD794_02875 [Flavisolibacter sp.]|nr:hypothetical protein [Flavisolibacter sp.]
MTGSGYESLIIHYSPLTTPASSKPAGFCLSLLGRNRASSSGSWKHLLIRLTY